MSDLLGQPGHDPERDGLFPGLLPAASAEKPAGYQVLARKYRPRTFDELIGQDLMVRVLTNAFALGRIHQAYMLTGVRGVGKTTTARILARALNYEVPAHDGQPAINQPSVTMPVLGVHCQAIIDSRHVDVIEMDAASHTGIDDIREIIDSARYKPAVARMKVYIIDEVHMLSKAAFNGLLKTLEEPPEHVKFIFATTEIEKVPVTVRSRCLRFDLRRIETEMLIDHLAGICVKEHVPVEREAVAIIARAAEGSVRDSLSLLDQAIAHGGNAENAAISAAEIRAMLGLADKARIFDLFDDVMSGRIAPALTNLSAQFDDGAEPAQILLELAEFVHLVTRIKVAPEAPVGSVAAHERERAAAFAEKIGLPVLNRAWQILLKGLTEVRESQRALAAADMVLVRLAYLADMPTPDEALRKLGFGTPQDGKAAPQSAARGLSAPGQDASQSSARPQARSQGSAAPAPQAPPWQDDAPAPRTATTPVAASKPDSAPYAIVKTFADVVAKAAAERDIQLKNLLERDVRLVRFERGQIEFALAEGGSQQLAQTLMRRMQEWTGERWLVALSSQPGAPTLREQAQAQTRARDDDVAQDPLVRSVMERFPGAKIIAVRARGEDDVIEPALSDDDQESEDFPVGYDGAAYGDLSGDDD